MRVFWGSDFRRRRVLLAGSFSLTSLKDTRFIKRKNERERRRRNKTKRL
ncbi:hypothetical protein BaLi_c10460 [Bacillus paralicheniformis ATCC 9945a]|nr:hypothetical protein BaLi_c10460 [Bacillus paralicheniformis ATCC 9945a]